MKREIKFRGKRVDNGQWVYGNINFLQDGVFILEHDQQGVIEQPDYHRQGMGCGLEDRDITDRYDAMEHGWENAIERQSELLPLFIEVHPETVGQYTGLKDKDGKEIYEGDVLYHESHETTTLMKWIDRFVCFAGESLELLDTNYYYQLIDQSRLVIKSNIHDNPELIK